MPPTPISGHLSFPRVERTRNALNRSTRSGLSHPPASSPLPWSPMLTRYAAHTQEGWPWWGEVGQVPGHSQLQMNVSLYPTLTPATLLFQPRRSLCSSAPWIPGQPGGRGQGRIPPCLLATRCSHLLLPRHSLSTGLLSAGTVLRPVLQASRARTPELGREDPSSSPRLDIRKTPRACSVTKSPLHAGWRG